MSYLEHIETPADLRKLSVDQLPQLCEELRQFIIEQTAKRPGHLGSSLGMVELTVALHYVFDTPNDKLVWDVGHQAYGHKILTGRKNQFHTNRTYGGISGFPRREESEYDAFGTGHSSTSISAILGMAMAAKMNGDSKRSHIAVIGDGAMTGGMAFEAMNQAAYRNVNMMVILNDNKMSIDSSTGAMSKYLLKITASPAYNRFKNHLWNLFTFKSNQSNKITDFFGGIGNGLKGYLFRRKQLVPKLGIPLFRSCRWSRCDTSGEDIAKFEGPSWLEALPRADAEGQRFGYGGETSNVVSRSWKVQPRYGSTYQFQYGRDASKVSGCVRPYNSGVCT